MLRLMPCLTFAKEAMPRKRPLEIGISNFLSITDLTNKGQYYKTKFIRSSSYRSRTFSLGSCI